MAWLLRPELFQMQKMYVEIDTSAGPNLGRTVADVWNVTGKPANAEVALGVDADGFFRLIAERIGNFG